MTAAGRRRKRGAVRLTGLLAAAGVAGALSSAVPIGAATTEYLVINRHTGLAISGFDPVAYFTDGDAKLGRGEYESAHAGAVWRFRNAGNRSAFIADPEIYEPRFGGYDPIGVARGVALPGDPRLWPVAGDRLYLFATAADRDSFAGERQHLATTADKMWPSVQHTLAP